MPRFILGSRHRRRRQPEILQVSPVHLIERDADSRHTRINCLRASCSGLLLLAFLCVAEGVGFAQTPSPVEEPGFQPHRDYFAELPFEHVDLLSGSLVLTFTDLVLPGPAGRELRFQRTWNSKGVPRWTFGLAGVALRVLDPGWAPVEATFPDRWAWTPTVVTADGAARRAYWMDAPDTSSVETIRTTMRWVSTAEFWRYDRELRRMFLPDGTVGQYDDQGRLTQVTDVVGNTVTVVWDVGGVTVRQQFGTAPPREVFLDGMDGAGLMPARLRYEGRTWTYERGAGLDRAIPPVGPAWEYTRETDPAADAAGQLLQVRTPGGGLLTYTYARQTFQTSPTGSDVTLVVRTRAQRPTDLPPDAAPPTWTYTYGNVTPSGTALETVVATPPGTRLTYRHAPVDDPAALMGSPYALVERLVEQPAGGAWQTLESETRTYTYVPVIEHREQLGPVEGDVIFTIGTPALTERRLVREGRSYVTRYEYRPTPFGDFHHPWRITEAGESGATSRVTELDYAHLPLELRRVIAARRTRERVTANGETFVRTWDPDPATGVVRAATAYGVTTRFARDAFGNIAEIRDAHDHVTAMTYAWGAVSGLQTAAHATTRAIHRDGTVASETRAGRTTTFEYDALARLRATRPPGGTTPVLTAYDEGGGAWVRTSRGDAATTTTYDGFGRAVRTVNAVGVETRTRYDAEGRVVYESYPFEGSADIGTSLAYDGLGRVTRRTHPDGSAVTYTYGPGTVTIRDENGRETLHRVEAFGDPDETRLVGVTDADARTWTYAYNGLGRLTDVVAPDGIARTWRYHVLADGSGTDRLAAETHPESGQTTYAYDEAGQLVRKTYARGTVFDYSYDANDRLRLVAAGDSVTEITYEPGTDERRTMRLDGLTTTFGYEPATGRLESRTDVVDGRAYRVAYAYDLEDRLTRLTYPSGRRVGYDYDAAGRLTRVFDDTAGRDYATALTYHASGAAASYTTGNGLPHAFTLDPQRYWPRTIAAGALSLSYEDYDGAGNVRTIRDSRPGFDQVFAYDALDRLTAAQGAYGTAEYAYGVHGDRVTHAGTTYDYWPGTLRLRRQIAGGITRELEYDGNGNVITAQGTTYRYTPHNMLESATGAGLDSTFAYDADHWRVRKTVGPETTIYLRGPNNELLTEWTNPGTTPRTFRDYIYAGARLVAVVEQR